MAGETALDLAGWRAALLELSGAALSSDAQQEVAKISKVVARLDRKGLTGPNPELTMAVRAIQSDPPNLLLARECDQRRSGGVMSRSCQFRQVEIRRDTSSLRTDVLVLRDRMRRIEEGIQRHRLEGRSYTGTARVPAQDRRFRIVRDALSVPCGTWQSVMQPFIRKAAREPNRVSPLLGYKTTQPRRLTDAYLVKLKAVFASPGPPNPFSGTLGREQLIRSQK